jgi:uncharacterized protein (TIGR00375 family)
MDFIADLHIHSHHSMATSKQLRPEYLDYWAKIKGIKVVGTGDFTHPEWLKELKEKLEPAENGLFKLKEDYKIPHFIPETPENEVRFMLSAEISNIYKKQGVVRKIHSVILAPDFETVERYQHKLSSMNFNITSDGRPILGLDVRDLLEITLEISDRNFFIPAHIWTPWFSVFGSKSGFDRMEDCFEDLSHHIHAVETGLSTDPPLNWMCSFLDRYTLLSNSDAHSPEKLGRNANLFRSELSYDAMVEAMKTGDPSTFGGTIDMYPQEGKYHYDGHRKCQVRWSPVETLKHHGICPVCGKKVTVGVTNRIVKLSDREDITQKENRLPYYSLIPLKEMISEIEGVGEKSKKVSKRYEQLINKAGSEFNLLHFQPLEQVREVAGEVIGEGIRRMRNNEVIIKEGYDGEYGQIKVFQPDEVKYLTTQESLFDISGQFKKTEKRKLINFDLAEYRKLEQLYTKTDQAAEPETEYIQQKNGLLKRMNAEQAKAVQHPEGPAVVIAGPGTGKTKVLTHRIAWLINEIGIHPEHILAITFTNKASEEMQTRCDELIGKQTDQALPTISTFHALGYSILREYAENTGRNAKFTIADENIKRQLIQSLFQCSQQETKKLSEAFSRFKQQNIDPDGDKVEAFHDYENHLAQYNLFDLEDLIYQVVQLANSNPVIQENLRDQYQWVLVDEFQDINKIQYDFLNIICNKEDSNLFIIGDPNQAIYGFRGSSRKFISHFVEDYTNSRVYKLKTSYRCSDNILKASGDILEEDNLSGLQEGVRIKIAPQQTEKSEAEYIARTIEQLSGGLRFFSMDSKVTGGESDKAIESLSDFAVLCRTKAQMKPIEKALNDHTIPYQKVSEDEFFQHSLVKIVRDSFYFALDPENPYLQQRIKLHGLDTLANGAIEKIQKCNHIPDAIEYLADQFISESDRNEEVLKRLVEIGKQFNDKINEFLKYLSLGTETDIYQKETEKVSLMTLHASKGLEFQCAFIAGCEKGLIPYELFRNQEVDYEEEKRLLYVGMTRAKSYLYLTHARNRFIMGQEKQMQRSPFLNRIEKELTEIEKNTYKKKQKDDSQLKLF